MGKKFVLFLAAWIAALPLAGAENLLRDPAFSRAGKRDADWYFVRKPDETASAFKAADGVLRLEVKQPGGAIFSCQRIAPEPGKRYIASFEARGLPGADINAYAEWRGTDGRYRNRTFPKKPVLQRGWKKYEFAFSGDETMGTGKNRPYLAIRLRNRGVLEIRNPSLCEDTPFDKLPGGSCDDAKFWTLGPSARIAPRGGYAGSGMLVLKDPGARAVHKNLFLSGGDLKLNWIVMGQNNENSANGFAEFSVKITDDSGKVIAESGRSDCFSGTWQRKELVFKAPPCRGAQLVCESFSGGLVCFDDFKLTKISPADVIPVRTVLSSPYYRDMIFSTDPVTEIAGRVETTGGVKEIKITFDGKPVDAVPGQNGGWRFAVPAAHLPEGRHKLFVTALLKNGKTFTETRVIEKLPPGKNEVIVKSDNNLYVNGKPFFFQQERVPLYDTHPGAVSYMRRMNVTASHTFWTRENVPAATVRKRLDFARDNNLKCVVVIPVAHLFGAGNSPEAAEKTWKNWLEVIRGIRDHDGLLAYYLFDEPLWNGLPLETVKRTYEDVKRADPYHPVIACEAPRGLPDDWRPYARYCDIFGIDIYPVPEASKHSELPEKGLRSVGEYTRLALDAVDGRKPVRMVLQAFSWGMLGGRGKGVYPTKKEMRFMYYDALLHGARSLGYFSLSLHKKEVCADFFDVVTEIAAVAPALLFGKELKCYVSRPEIRARLFEFRGEKYLIAVNRSEKIQNPVFTVPGVLYHVLGEKRAVDAKAGRFADKFEPWDVHVYGSSPDLPVPPSPFAPGERSLLDDYLVKRTRRLPNLRTRAGWIWNAAQSPKVYFLKKFTLPGEAAEGVLRITADDGFTAYLNGEKICSGNDWAFYQEKTVTAKLLRGENLLAVEAENGGGACGLLADLEVRLKTGENLSVTTDGTWRVSTRPGKDWQKGGLTDGEPAKVLFPFGKGPWRY
ncbi:MAG: hypothetical protein IJS01_02615 [Lentisphaeria bacterium]|nr:hypothetical protein [Lentisphaeria bacterium]